MNDLDIKLRVERGWAWYISEVPETVRNKINLEDSEGTGDSLLDLIGYYWFNTGTQEDALKKLKWNYIHAQHLGLWHVTAEGRLDGFHGNTSIEEDDAIDQEYAKLNKAWLEISRLHAHRDGLRSRSAESPAADDEEPLVQWERDLLESGGKIIETNRKVNPVDSDEALEREFRKWLRERFPDEGSWGHLSIYREGLWSAFRAGAGKTES